ncbi:thiamine pyrophosphate-dependent enzyme [Sphingobium sp. YBL2]|uniref:thiamine pyrophosphate-dependent enzyme n=1 Tax=Sphingobium sp. (strain YBL2) TaxID=484429 RepID=UPI001EE33FF3|nr:thiamine pyrophosphate-dependent enzyme [Sphingobium sp. YBL2]
MSRPKLVPAEDDIDRLTKLLTDQPAVTLLCGSGCAGLHDEVVQLADRLGAPVVHALRGKEYVEWDNPFDVGMTGLIGFSSGYHAMMNCDLLLMLGTDFPYRNFYPAKAKVVQVDRDPGALGRRVPLDLAIHADVGETIRALLPRLAMSTKRGFVTAARDHYRKAREGLDHLATPAPAGKPVHPQYLAHLIDKLAAEDAIIAADVGTPTVWAARYISTNGKRRLLFSANHGSMANALPQAIGAQAAAPGRQVVAMSGDGGIAMLLGDLLSLKQLKLRVKVVVFDNQTLGFVAMEQKAGGFLPVNTTLENPDFAAIAEASGILGLRADDSTTLEAALRQAFDHDGPALVQVRTATQELAMPPAIKFEQAKGFSLYALKAVLSGRGDELIELAKTNLR